MSLQELDRMCGTHWVNNKSSCDVCFCMIKDAHKHHICRMCSKPKPKVK